MVILIKTKYLYECALPSPPCFAVSGSSTGHVYDFVRVELGISIGHISPWSYFCLLIGSCKLYGHAICALEFIMPLCLNVSYNVKKKYTQVSRYNYVSIISNLSAETRWIRCGSFATRNSKYIGITNWDRCSISSRSHLLNLVTNLGKPLTRTACDWHSGLVIRCLPHITIINVVVIPFFVLVPIGRCDN